MKRALITGVTGQDGSYLCELLISKGYEVDGLVRRTSLPNHSRISHNFSCQNFKLLEGEISDSFSVYSIIENGNFDEVYNLAAQSHVATSFEQPMYTFDVNTKGTLNFLEAIRKYSPKTKFYQASTSEMFGKNYKEELDNIDGSVIAKYQDESTDFMPQSPYAAAKLAAHNLVRIYRDSYGLFACSGILFNHESPRRGDNFVTRKITKWIGDYLRWKSSLTENFEFDFKYKDDIWTTRNEDGWLFGPKFPKLRLGNLDAYRDWGHAQDYVGAMYLMLQREKPEDYVISTGETRSIRDFLTIAFEYINISNYEDYIVIDPKFYRPAEVDYLRGDSTKANKELGWYPKISFRDLVKEMILSDINEKKL